MIHLLEKLFNLTSSAMLMPFIIISVIAAIAPIIVFIIHRKILHIKDETMEDIFSFSSTLPQGF